VEGGGGKDAGVGEGEEPRPWGGLRRRAPLPLPTSQIERGSQHPRLLRVGARVDPVPVGRGFVEGKNRVERVMSG
jgi:hypothetical protein